MEAFIFRYTDIIGSPLLLLAIELIAFLLKIGIGISLITLKPTSTITKQALFLLGVIIFSAILADFSWIFKLSREELFPILPLELHYFFLRIAWAFAIILHQALALFLLYLIRKHMQLHILQKIGLCLSALLFLSFLYTSITCYYDPIMDYEIVLQKIVYIHTFLILIPVIFISLHELKNNSLPKILKKQASLFIYLFLAPYLLSELLTLEFYSFSLSYHIGSYGLVSISTFLMTYAIYSYTRRMLQLRFLNMGTHVHAHKKSNFIDEFSYVLEQLSSAESFSELNTCTQNFFKNAFNISPSIIQLVIRGSAIEKDQERSFFIEQFLSLHYDSQCSVGAFMRSNRILITDELEFTNFYTNDSAITSILEFLKNIKVDIFIPLYNKQLITAYIIIKENARPKKFFSSVERDEMLIFISYVSNTINILQQNNIQELLLQNKILKDTAQEKHQEIKQYKESIKVLLHNKKGKEIALIFYKNKRFVYANKCAHDILTIDLNLYQGHSLTRSLKKITENVLLYSTAHRSKQIDLQGNPIIVNAVPISERGTVLITVHYPDVIDIIMPFVERLKDPSDWDYLLYLETTLSGQLIHDLFPGQSDTILGCKIQLLKATLTHKAALLTTQKEDLLPLVELIHTISLRAKLHILRLSSPESHLEVAIALFGIHPLYAKNLDSEPLLLQLKNSGTLFIENVHLLSKETQDMLVYYLRYGFFKQCKSNQRYPSNACLLFSTTFNLEQLVSEQKFSAELLEILYKNHIILPSLLVLPLQELESFTEEYAESIIKKNKEHCITSLTNKEKDKILKDKPSSILALKNKVEKLLTEKSKKQGYITETPLGRELDSHNAEISQLIKLGKHALKDPIIMTLLWQKFKSQNKIALLLGVNRSSVNRRCKDYRLL